MQTWAYKRVYFQYEDGHWRRAMLSAVPEDEGDEHSRYPMADYVDVLGREQWELVSAVPVDSPEPGLLLLIFKRPDDHEQDTLIEVPGELGGRRAVVQEAQEGSEASALGKVLRQLRIAGGLTQSEVAFKADTAPEYISMLETGLRKNPSAQLLARIAVALGATPDYILARAGILTITEEQPLDPEVQRLVGVLAALPEGTSRRAGRAIVNSVANLLERIIVLPEEEDVGE